MDKRQQLSDKKKSAVLRIQRTEAYAERVRLLFAKTVNDILALNKSMPKLEEGVMYSFDGTNDKMQKEVEMLLRRLASTVTTAIRNGINLEWEEANVECDKFIASLFGKKVLSSPEFSAWVDRNTSARDAFTNRADKGLGLSERVWKSVKQLREEMEVAMTVAIGEGDSASSMSRKVREYLNDPELMFRRFRYKAGEKEVVDKDTGEITKVPVYGRKWKKRVKDESTGKYRWVDYDRDSYKTGAGAYKSSAKNAMRVARTETNMAYRQADHQRWQNMEFVLGQHIELSRNHPKRDICDDLEGDYPKDFIFDGWHPQCFCVCTPILVDWEEQRKVFRAKLKGETYTPKGKRITECPDNFKSWVSDNKEKIHVVRKSGKEPYFIKNNAAKIDGIIHPDKAASAKAEVHNMEVAQKYANKMLDYTQKNHPNMDTSKLQDALKSGNSALISKEAQAVKVSAQKKTAQIKKQADHVLKMAKGYNEVDFAPLEKAIMGGNVRVIKAATKQVGLAASAMKKQEADLENIIPNVHHWHKTFSIGELSQVKAAVENTLNKWLTKYGYKSWDEAPNEHKKNKLIQEVSSLVSGKKHPTWEVAEKAYQKKLGAVQDALALEELMNKLNEHKEFLKGSKTKSSIYKGYIAALDKAIADKDTIKGIAILEQLEAKKVSLEAKKKTKENIFKEIKSTNNTLQKEHISKGMKGKELISKIMEMTNTTDTEEAESYFEAVRGFSFQWDYEIRQVQSGNSVVSRHGHSNEEILKKARDLEKFIAKSPQWDGGTTYRGMTLSNLELEALRKELKNGKGNMQGSASWSTRESVSRNFSGAHLGESSPVYGDVKNNKVMLVAHKHKKATSIRHLSRFSSEDEVLTSMFCRYKLVAERKEGSYIILEVEAT